MSFSWFRRRPPPVLLPPLDRLAELIDRVIALLDQPVPAAAGEGETRPESSPNGHVLFVASLAGYRLLERDGPAPAHDSELEVDGERFRVLRAGPSPLPDDSRRCVFLEREEPASPGRTLDG